MTTATDESKKFKLFQIIQKHYVKISILSYLAAFALFGLLISEQFCPKTYFSDNALLPGFVRREFDLKSQTSNNLHELRSLKLSHGSDSESKIPVDWLIKKFRSLGLQVYTQDFKLNYPFGNKHNLTGTNVYAVFKSTRSLGTEALVLSSPFRSNTAHTKSTLPGISLLISLAEYFSTKNYWSKDLIFLIYEHDLIGCEAWLNAYYDLSEIKKSSLIEYEMLEDRTGIIQAAINLEITSEQTPNLDIKIEGLNGQLPNLDLFNVVVEIASRESIDPTFHQLSHLFSPDQLEIWIEYTKSIGSMMQIQASTFASGAHGLFQKRSIQSLTLVAEEELNDQDYLKADLIQIGKVIEGVFRSCNNMIERFNRSYWFYLLPSTRRYLSIGLYMIPLGLIVLPSLLKALVIYLQMIEHNHLVTETFWVVLPQLFWTHLCGLVIASFPFIIQNSSKLQLHFNFKTDELLLYSLLSFMSSLMFSPIINQDLETQETGFKSLSGDRAQSCSVAKEKVISDDAEGSKIISIRHYVALLELATLIACLSLVNISLALCLSAVFIPIMCSISRSFKYPKTRGQQLAKNLFKFLLILINPLVLIYLCELVNSLVIKSNQSLLVHLSDSFTAQKQFILSLVENWYLFGNWTYLIGSLAIFPIWLQFWYLL